MKKLLIPTLLATALLTQAACGNMAGSVAQELVSSYWLIVLFMAGMSSWVHLGQTVTKI